MDNMKGFSIVVAACSSNMGIGKNGSLPWRLAGDMAHFKNITCATSQIGHRNAVIMGRKTWESIPMKFRPLKDRMNIILSKNANLRDVLQLEHDVIIASSLHDALTHANNPTIDHIFVIGGGMIYEEAMQSALCKRIYFTEVNALNPASVQDMDCFFPMISAFKYRLVKRSSPIEEPGFIYHYTEFERVDDHVLMSESSLTSEKYHVTTNIISTTDGEEKTSISSTSTSISSTSNEEESQYLNIIHDILANGSVRGDRTGTGTISKFGVQMRFSLRKNRFPLLTTKKVFWRGVAEELIWFIHGSTDANKLKEKGIHIWDGNGSREFLDKLGFTHRVEGDLGPVYGFQWRHFGAKYQDMSADYTGQGIDQLLECINKIKNSPYDRRIIMTAWNPLDLDNMALPPCHMFCQFYVANNELSCQMYQRSADMGLGVPFNIASYALLTAMMAQVCGLGCGDLVHTIGDAHIYLNHVDALKEQLTRTPRAFPTIRLNADVKDIDAFTYADFTIQGYDPYPAIQMQMAV